MLYFVLKRYESLFNHNVMFINLYKRIHVLGPLLLRLKHVYLVHVKLFLYGGSISIYKF